MIIALCIIGAFFTLAGVGGLAFDYDGSDAAFASFVAIASGVTMFVLAFIGAYYR